MKAQEQKQAHILVVDDQAQIVVLMKKILEKLGYRVSAYSDSFSALEYYRSHAKEIDLVISDMSMPGMRGDQLCREIRKVSKRVGIILCTGHDEVNQQILTRQLGANKVIAKPIRMKTLGMVVEDVMNAGSKDRRRYERYVAMDSAIAIPKSDTSRQGRVLDLNLAGMAFRYIENRSFSWEAMEGDELKIWLPKTGYNVDDIPFETIADFKVGNLDIGLMAMKRCGVRFKALTTEQKERLDFIIRNHTLKRQRPPHEH